MLCTRSSRAIALATLAVAPATALAQTHPVPRLLADINTQPGTFLAPQGASLGMGTPTIAYFAFGDPVNQNEVWRTDGTPEGTRPVGDLTAFRPNIFGLAGNTLLFESNFALLATDGDPGDFSTILPVVAVPNRNSIDFWLPHASRGGRLFFTATNGASAILYASDGTAAGTSQLFSTTNGFPGIASIAATPTKVFAAVTTSGQNTRSLVVSVGDPPQPATTVRTFSALGSPTPGVPFGWLTPTAGDSVAFIAPDVQGRRQIWTSDGADAGTIQLTAFTAFSVVPHSLAWNGSRLAFVGQMTESSAEPAMSLWLSDGTPQGTVRASFSGRIVSALSLGSSPDTPRRPLIPFRGGFAMVAETQGEPPPVRRLYVGDGSAAGTLPIDIGAFEVVEFIGSCHTDEGEVAFFTAFQNGRTFVWRTDGTALGTILLPGAPGAPNPAEVRPLAVLGSRFIFGARDAFLPTRWTVWITDTAGRTVTQIAGDGITPVPNRSSTPANFTPFGGQIVFGADNGPTGNERYRASAAPGSAELCEESIPGDDVNLTPDFVHLGGRLFTHASRRITVGKETLDADALLITDDPTQLGTVLYQSNGTERIRDLSPMNGVLYFGGPADESTPDNTLWRSDGTPEGTHPVVPPGPQRPINPVTPVFEWQGRGYFFARAHSAVNFALWSTDGTPTGTTQLADFASGFTIAQPTFCATSQRLYFNAYTAGLFNRLWVTDGTPAGTRELDSTFQMTLSGLAKPMAVLNDTLLVSGYRAQSDADLWTPNLDHTAVEPVATIPGASPATATSLTPVSTPDGPRIVFASPSTGNGTELWITDGSAKGTHILADIWPGTLSSSPSTFAPAGDLVVFVAATAQTGRELWQTDGTPGGTRVVAEINPGPNSSFPQGFAYHQGVLFFSAASAEVGREPYAIRMVPCLADFNSDGFDNSQDFFDFLTAFFANAPDADVNADGFINSQDFFDFLGAFFAGCAF